MLWDCGYATIPFLYADYFCNQSGALMIGLIEIVKGVAIFGSLAIVWAALVILFGG